MAVELDNPLRIGSYIAQSTSGSVLFASSTNLLAQNNANLNWDDSNNKLLVKGKSGQSSNLFETQIFGSTTALARVDSTGNFSRSVTTQSEQFGAGSIASATGSLAFGYIASSSALNGLAIGTASGVSVAGGTAIGYFAYCAGAGAGSETAIGRATYCQGTIGVAIGNAATTGTGQGCIAIGASSSATGGDGCITIGYASTITGSNGANIGRTNTNTGGFSFGFRINDCGLGDVTFGCRTDASAGGSTLKMQTNRAFATELTSFKIVNTLTDTTASWKARTTMGAFDSSAYREAIRFEADGSVARLGFYGATAVVKPSNTTDLRQALIDLGLYTTGGATPLDLNGGSLAGVADLNGVTAFQAQGSAGDVQFSDGAGGFFVDGGAFWYDYGIQVLYALTIDAQSLNLANPLDVASGGTGGLALDSGTYTPTFTNVANISANTNSSCQYLRVGDTVTVSGRVSIDPTVAATLTQLGISLPIASSLSHASHCAGTAATGTVTGYSAAIYADVANARAQLEFTTAVDVANQDWYFHFTYRVE